MQRNDPVDWATIQREYTSTVVSVGELAEKHCLSRAAIQKRARERGWTRPETAPKRPEKKRDLSVTYRVEETTVVATVANPEGIAERGYGLAIRLLDELDAATSHPGELEAIIMEATGADESPKRAEALMKAVSLGSRAATLKALATAVKTLAEANVAAPQGKKQQRQDAAEKVGGRFSTPTAPKLVVDNRQ